MLGVKFSDGDKGRVDTTPLDMGYLNRPGTMQELIDFIKVYNTFFNVEYEPVSYAKYIQGATAVHYKKRNGAKEWFVHQSDIGQDTCGLIAIDIDRPDLSMLNAIDREEVLSALSVDFGALLWMPSKSVKRGNNKMKGRIFIHAMVQEKTKIRAQLEQWFWEKYGAGYYVKGHINNARWFMGEQDHPSVVVHEFIDEVSFRPSQKMNAYWDWFEVYDGALIGRHDYKDVVNYNNPWPAKKLNLYDEEYVKFNVGDIKKRSFGKYYVGLDKYLSKTYGGIPVRDLVPGGAGSTLVGVLVNAVESMRNRLKKIGVSASIKNGEIFREHDKYFKEGVLYESDTLRQGNTVRTVLEWVEILKNKGCGRNFTPEPNTHYENKENFIYWTGSFFKNFHTGENYYEIEKYSGITWFDNYLPAEFYDFEGRVCKHAPTGSGKNYGNRNKNNVIVLVPTKALGYGLHNAKYAGKNGYVYIASTDHKVDVPKRIIDIPDDRSDCTIVMTYDKFSYEHDQYLGYKIIVDEVNNLFSPVLSKYSISRDRMIHSLFTKFKDVMFMSADDDFQKNVDMIARKHDIVVPFEDYNTKHDIEINIVNRDHDFIASLVGKRVLLYCNSISKAYNWKEIIGNCEVIKSEGDIKPEEVDLNLNKSYVFTSAIREGYSFSEPFDKIIVDCTAGQHNSALTSKQAWSRVRKKDGVYTGDYYVLVENSQEKKDFGIDLYYKYIDQLLGDNEDARVLRQYFDGYYNVKNALFEEEGVLKYLDTVLLGIYIQGQADIDKDHNHLVKKIKEFGYKVNYNYKEDGNLPMSSWIKKIHGDYEVAGLDSLKTDIDIVKNGGTIPGLTIPKAKKFESTLNFMKRVSKLDDNGYLDDKNILEQISELHKRPNYAGKLVLMESVYKAFSGLGFQLGKPMKLKDLEKSLDSIGIIIDQDKLLRFFDRLYLTVDVHKIMTGDKNRSDTLWSTYKTRQETAIEKVKLIKQIGRFQTMIKDGMNSGQYKRILVKLKNDDLAVELGYNKDIDDTEEKLVSLIDDYKIYKPEGIPSGNLYKNNTHFKVSEVIIQDPLLWFDDYCTPRRAFGKIVNEEKLVEIWKNIGIFR